MAVYISELVPLGDISARAEKIADGGRLSANAIKDLQHGD